MSIMGFTYKNAHPSYPSCPLGLDKVMGLRYTEKLADSIITIIEDKILQLLKAYI